jgi:hypothetical protein
MIDPSLLVSATADKGLQSGLESFKGGNDEFETFVSNRFVQLVNESTAYSDDPTFSHFMGRLSNKSVTEFAELREIVAGVETFSPADVEESSFSVDYDTVEAEFLDRYPPATKGALGEVLYEEFVFLLERSQIASRTSRTPEKDLNGVHTLALNKEEVEEMLEQSDGNYFRQLEHRKKKKGWNYIHTIDAVEELLDPTHVLADAMFDVGMVPGMLAIEFDP